MLRISENVTIFAIGFTIAYQNMKWIRNALKGVSLTAAMFVFQACYGTMQDEFAYTEPVSFRVISDDGQPIPDVAIEVQPQESLGESTYDWEYLGSTDSMGLNCCRFRDFGMPNKFRFTDRDSVYAVKDTVINNYAGNDTIEIVLSKQA